MAFKIVNLAGGLNTQDDPKTIGFEGFTALQNVRQANGKLKKRFGTGTASSLSSAEIDNMVMFVHRKLSGFKILNTATNNVVFDDADSSADNKPSLTIGGTMNTTNIHAPGFDATDLTSMFKPGDSVFIKHSTTCANDDEVYVIDTIPAANKMTFLAPVTDETLNGSSQTFKIAFAIADYNDIAPTGVVITTGNSFDGRAFFATYLNTTKFISMINPLDYTDNIALEDFGSNTSDMHIRPRAYADAVRFSCGLEHSPRIFRYVNRHFFNGIFKSVWNPYADLLYPRWIIDTAVPTVTSETFISTSTELKATGSLIKYIDGSLDLTRNNFDYKIVPVYEGTQEELLENSVVTLSTQGKILKNKEPDGILSRENSCVKIKTVIDLAKLNPRTSTLNVYRSRNGGTYYKIKSINMGEDDSNQKSISTTYFRDDMIFFTGGGSFSTTTFNSHIIMVDGFKYSTTAGEGLDDFNSTGYHSQALEDDSSAATFLYAVKEDSNMSQEYYGSAKICKFNHESEETETIFANNGEVIGGSPNGGWYVASGLHSADFNTTASFQNAAASQTAASNDTSTPGPFTSNFATSNSGDGSNAFHYSFTNSSSDDSMKRWVLGTDVSGGNTYIVSGWIRASGFNHPSVEWSFFLDDSSHGETTSTGTKLIAQGSGGDINQNIDKWRYFQFEYTSSGSGLKPIYAYVRIYTESEMGIDDSNMIRIKALSVRLKLADFGLTDDLKGYCGANLLVSTNIEDLGVPSGLLKGNRILNDSTYSYPSYTALDRTYISNNDGPFIQTVSDIESVNSTTQNDTFMLSVSNYQFYIYNHAVSGWTNASGASVALNFFDTGLPDGARHPNNGVTSLDVKHKYSTMLNGRQFVANVKISADGESEEYPNFVMFSEPNAPDIIPVGNYIQLQDLQGGEIVGIETLMSDLVVFMTNGIFRISVPSNDPQSWSLVEAHPNIGCLNDKAIAKSPNGIYFLSESDVYFLDSGFQASPISYAIRDDYQTVAASTPGILRAHYDVKYNRLYVTKTVSTNTFFFVFDILKQIWSTEKHSDALYDEFALDNNNNTILIETASTSKIRNAVDTSEFRDDAGGTPKVVAMTVTTGEQELVSYDKNAFIRRINTSVNVDGGTGMDLTSTGPLPSPYALADTLTGKQSFRTSQRGKSITLTVSDNVSEDKVKEVSHVSIEYE